MQGSAPEAALDAVMREDRGRIIAALIADLRDFQLAEDALQEASVSALQHWGRTGPPHSPRAWLLRVARRKAIDRLRGAAREGRKAAALALLVEEEAREAPVDEIADERLRLIFTCCHPALEPKTRVALTLRTLGGLTTAEIARAFLDAEGTMGQRLSRARAKIAAAGIPFAIPGPELWEERLGSVLTVIYLIFNAGYTAGAGAEPIRVDLCEEAIFLARLVLAAREEAETEGLLALMLLTHARRGARFAPDGAMVPLDSQDRSKWQAGEREEGLALLDRAMGRRQPGPFQIKAAIAALHGAEATDWAGIALLYDSLARFEPTPVVRLNRAVALAEAGELGEALAETDRLATLLDGYQPFHAARAELLGRAGRTGAAREAYDRAIGLTDAAAEVRFLRARRDRLGGGPSSPKAINPEVNFANGDGG